MPDRKPFPSTFKYIFLDEGESYPVVISSSLMEAQESSLLEVLKKYHKAIGWTITNLHGINPLLALTAFIFRKGLSQCAKCNGY